MDPDDRFDDPFPIDEVCDGCGNVAVLRVFLTTGGVLSFCPWCWSRNEAVLREIAQAVRG